MGPLAVARRLRAARPCGALLSRALSSVAAAHTEPTIVYTLTDEAPALATYALLPIVNRFTGPAGIGVTASDISVASRILAQFPERLTPEQRVPDNLAELGELSKHPHANIIKLPNVSASVPQLNEAISELRAKGYDVPLYPADPQTDEELEIRAKYAKVIGSAVNPVLREGNSDRRVARPVKEYAKANPSKMAPWRPDSLAHVAHMSEGDFYGSEQSATVGDEPCIVDIVLTEADGYENVLKDSVLLAPGEVIDAATMSLEALGEFFEREIEDARAQGTLLSLHLKATMMKVSDPIIFGQAVRAFFKPVFERHANALEKAGANPNLGWGDVLAKIGALPEAEQAAIRADIDACFAARPPLAMVDSDRGITNLHVPSDVIVDASMPNVVRDAGCMWNPKGELQETKCLIPDRSYATMYSEAISFCKEHGQFDPKIMGNVANVGLMAQKAEEYGSHDKTFQMPADGVVRVIRRPPAPAAVKGGLVRRPSAGGEEEVVYTPGEGSAAHGEVIFEHVVKKGDIWRMCQTKDEPIRDWVRLAVDRARSTMDPVIFWLDPKRAHDAQLIRKVNTYLQEHELSGLDISVKEPVVAMRHTLGRARVGLDTVSVTGNVLRDYLTDLFPILELGTSSKMLSIVPLLGGGGLFETGAGGSAPKHVQQFVREGHLRWDSLGEYLAMAVSLEDFGAKNQNARATLLGQTLSAATARLLDHRRAPSRKVGEIDNRGESFYIALYWAEALSEKDHSFRPLAEALKENRTKIVQELAAAQGSPVDIGGYYLPDPTKCAVAMRPSATFNKIIDEGRDVGTCGVAPLPFEEHL